MKEWKQKEDHETNFCSPGIVLSNGVRDRNTYFLPLEIATQKFDVFRYELKSPFRSL